ERRPPRLAPVRVRHRRRTYPVVEEGGRYVLELPSVFVGREPQVPVLEVRQRLVVRAGLLPHVTPDVRARVDVVVPNEAVGIERTDNPVVVVVTEAVGIAVDHTDLGRDGTEVDTERFRSDQVVGIERED